MKTYYQCEKCGKVYNSWGECFEHEQNHITPDSYRVEAVSYLDPRPYPLDINVPMTDGAVIQYTFSHVLTPAPEASLEVAANE